MCTYTYVHSRHSSPVFAYQCYPLGRFITGAASNERYADIIWNKPRFMDSRKFIRAAFSAIWILFFCFRTTAFRIRGSPDKLSVSRCRKYIIYRDVMAPSPPPIWLREWNQPASGRICWPRNVTTSPRFGGNAAYLYVRINSLTRKPPNVNSKQKHDRRRRGSDQERKRERARENLAKSEREREKQRRQRCAGGSGKRDGDAGNCGLLQWG